MALYVQKLIPEARIPSLQPEGCYTIYASAKTVIPSKGSAVVPLGIYLLAPAGHVIQAMSGPESFNNGLEVGGYCSFNCPNPHFFKNSPSPQELRIKVYNHGELDHTVAVGHPIGQILIRQIYPFQVLETEQIHEMIANPPSIPSTTVKQKKLPKQAITYFKQLYVSDYNTVKAKYLSEANLVKIEEYKKNPNYISNPNKENLESAFAWGLLDRTTQDQIRAELVVLNEQEARVDQMAGSRLKPDDEEEETKGKKGAKKAPKKTIKDDDSGDADPGETNEDMENSADDRTDPDAGKGKIPKTARVGSDVIEDIEELNEEEDTGAKAAKSEEDADEEEEDEEEGDEEEEEVAPKPAPKPAAPVVKAAAKAAPAPVAGAKKKAAAR